MPSTAIGIEKKRYEPACPYCNSELDSEAKSFGHKLVSDEGIYYCNNPFCSPAAA